MTPTRARPLRAATNARPRRLALLRPAVHYAHATNPHRDRQCCGSPLGRNVVESVPSEEPHIRLADANRSRRSGIRGAAEANDSGSGCAGGCRKGSHLVEIGPSPSWQDALVLHVADGDHVSKDQVRRHRHLRATEGKRHFADVPCFGEPLLQFRPDSSLDEFRCTNQERPCSFLAMRKRAAYVQKNCAGEEQRITVMRCAPSIRAVTRRARRRVRSAASTLAMTASAAALRTRFGSVSASNSS
jgi:hypothetical protein